ncbi:EAL domain-containing protein [Halanaerobiaceae bacterium Z-7014]|uniref:EAL domain-containing protein n=1 Tax=Halonatronomonas betaini TaxID=2778430 RepID=A0A931AVL7_9FIRM|nr:EAL domain-containing protein [Halonatronomonas betaini]MBF8435608.1 EAL domain-containing protein [Halonatronomonas betaini]
MKKISKDLNRIYFVLVFTFLISTFGLFLYYSMNNQLNFLPVIIIFLTGIYVARYFSIKMIRPLDKITVWADRLADGYNEACPVNPGYEELNTISDSLKKLAEKIEHKEKELDQKEQEIMISSQQIKSYNDEVTKLNKKLEYRTLYDPLTKLPNRRQFINNLKTELQAGRSGAVILIDLDNFKEVNDTLGHVYGDILLSQIGNRFLDLNDSNIFIARYGGDEFLILLKNVVKIDEVERYLKSVENCLNSSFNINDDLLNIEYSIGIALFPEDAEKTYDLITFADTAMHRAKGLFDQNKLYYNDRMFQELIKKKEIRELLKDALRNDGFKLVYQPQINLKSGKADTFEALLRLKDEDISPGEFISVAEESNLIIDIGRWVTEAAIIQLAEWQSKGLEPKPISINFSAKQLNDLSYVDFLNDKLKKHGVTADLLEIEITETVLLEKKDKSISFLNKLKKSGVKISLDDFGTGYSSLSYLTYIELDKIKFDRSLNHKFLQDNYTDTMAGLISLFHSMNLVVVAEGIEEKENFQKLSDRGCDYIQGYLFSRPVSPAAIEKIYDHNFI